MNQSAADLFIDRCTTAAADLALFFAGKPEDEMILQLEQVRSSLEAELAGTFGSDVAALMARRFVAAVAGRRKEIEAEAASPPSCAC